MLHTAGKTHFQNTAGFLLSAGFVLPKSSSLVPACLGLSHPWEFGDCRAWRGCGGSREGSKALRTWGWEGFAGGTPLELSWEHKFPSGAAVLPSHPQARGTSGHRRGRTERGGSVGTLCDFAVSSQSSADARGRAGGALPRAACAYRLSNPGFAFLPFFKRHQELSWARRMSGCRIWPGPAL